MIFVLKPPHPEDVRSTKILSVPLWILPNDQPTADDDSVLADEMRSRWLMLTTVSPITSVASGNLPVSDYFAGTVCGSGALFLAASFSATPGSMSTELPVDVSIASR